MKKRIVSSVRKSYQWYRQNLDKIILLIAAHFIAVYSLNLPYINLIKILFSFLPYVVDWIVLLLLFKPKKEFILKVALALLVFAIFPEILSVQRFAEFSGEIVFVLLVTVIFYSLKEIK